MNMVSEPRRRVRRGGYPTFGWNRLRLLADELRALRVQQPVDSPLWIGLSRLVDVAEGYSDGR